MFVNKDPSETSSLEYIVIKQTKQYSFFIALMYFSVCQSS